MNRPYKNYGVTVADGVVRILTGSLFRLSEDSSSIEAGQTNGQGQDVVSRTARPKAGIEQPPSSLRR